MPGQAHSEDGENSRIVLGLLESVARDGAQSQRNLAVELDVALGLVNAYLRRCIKKGLVKVSGVPARRYAYYLTPKGFAEKSRLTVEYLSRSFGFFRQAKADCSLVFQAARQLGFVRIVLAGKSDLAEIAAICALESRLQIIAVVDAETADTGFLNAPIVKTFGDLTGQCDAVIITDLVNTRQRYEAAVEWIGADRVLIPDLLRGHIAKNKRAVS
ncbi:MAG: winged helix-turn-helix transcriptional regulator [Pseudolabrys sp.]